MSGVGTVGQKLRLRLFLEGIEVPVIGAQVQMNLNAPATAAIQVIPTDRVLELKARTMVHLFYWDFNRSFEYTMTEDAEDSSPDPDVSLDGYKLLFGGEVIGLVMSKAPNGRQAVLQCADWSTYWDTTYQIFINWSPGGNFLGDKAHIWGGGNTMFHNILSSPSAKLEQYLNKKPKSDGLQNVRGLMGGIISLLEAMGGVPDHTSGINDFFTIAELKNHLLQQLVAEQNDNTAHKLFDSKAFNAWLSGRTTSLGSLISFRDMLKLLFHWIYYEIVPVSAPRYVPIVKEDEKAEKKKRTKYRSYLTAAQKQAVQALLKITRTYDGSRGEEQTLANQRAVNEVTVAKTVINGLNNLLDEITEKTRWTQEDVVSQIGAGTTLIRKAKLETLGEAFAGLGQITSAVAGMGRYTGQAYGKLSPQAKKHLYRARTQAEGVEPIPSSLRSAGSVTGLASIARTAGRLGKHYSDNRKRWALVSKELRKSFGYRPGRKNTGAKLDHLHTQIFRPDCFFVAPPRCNVLFPEQYVGYQFQRNFLQEVTRLRLTTGLRFISGTGAGFFQKGTFAPSSKEIKKLARLQGNKGYRTLLPWEKYSGILPKFEHISEINYQANRRQRELNRDVRGQAQSFSQRAANFNFMKYRFAARTLSVSAKFAPQFVLGFPGVLISSPFILNSEAVQKAMREAGIEGIAEVTSGDILANIGSLAVYFKAPTHYLGMPAGVSHSVDQASGSTSATLTHARAHRITDDDFLEVFSAEVSKTINSQVVTTELDAYELLRSGDYKKLRYLIDCTPQEDVLARAQAEDQGYELDEDPSDLLALSKRPTGAPKFADLTQLASAVFSADEMGLFHGRRIETKEFIERLDEQTDAVTGKVKTETKLIRLSGNTIRNPLKYAPDTTILEPMPYGKIQPPAKGPQGGKILHVQLFSDQVVHVSTSDIEQYAKSRKDKRRAEKRRKRNKEGYFLWKKAVIHEEIKNKKEYKPIPIEESIRPPWFSPLYSNFFIGEHIYEPFFGTGSVVDQSLFMTPEGEAFFGSSVERKELIAKIRSADGDVQKMSQALEEAKGKSLAEIPGVEQAMDALAFMYGEVFRQGLDVQKFVADYTSRPIATLREVLGSSNLEYALEEDSLKIVEGTGGFHSSAIAPYGDLIGLLDNPELELARIHKKGAKFPISRVLDPRPGRRAAVEKYAEEVSRGKGALAVGITG